MLTISPAQSDAFKDERLKQFSPRVDSWLQETAPKWAERAPAERQEILRDLLRLAEQARMRVETDYAVFAWIMFNSGRDWRPFAGRKDVREVLDAPDWRSESKILKLYELAFGT